MRLRDIFNNFDKTIIRTKCTNKTWLNFCLLVFVKGWSYLYMWLLVFEVFFFVWSGFRVNQEVLDFTLYASLIGILLNSGRGTCWLGAPCTIVYSFCYEDKVRWVCTNVKWLTFCNRFVVGLLNKVFIVLFLIFLCVYAWLIINYGICNIITVIATIGTKFVVSLIVGGTWFNSGRGTCWIGVPCTVVFTTVLAIHTWWMD